MQAPVFDRRRRAALGALAAALVAPAWAQRSPDRLITVGVEADLQASGLAARLSAAVARDTGFERRLLALLVLVCVLADWWLLARRAA